MSRKERREIDRAIAKLARRGEWRCDICRRDYEHGALTVTGMSVGGVLCTVGACCGDQMNVIYGSGVYLHHGKPFEAALSRVMQHPLRDQFGKPGGVTKLNVVNDDGTTMEADISSKPDH
jgi:hypothetical protein